VTWRADPAEGTHHRCRDAPRPVPVDRSDGAIRACGPLLDRRAGSGVDRP